MRLLLDAHISGRRIAEALRERGHDVHALDEDRSLDGLDDADVLALAVSDDRVLVTANVRDFLPLLRGLAEAGQVHAGCILIASSIRHHQFGAIIARVGGVLDAHPDPLAWRDRVHWLSRAGQ
jgi:predicted nuclease of predicted toxin-antitoxin system